MKLWNTIKSFFKRALSPPLSPRPKPWPTDVSWKMHSSSTWSVQWGSLKKPLSKRPKLPSMYQLDQEITMLYPHPGAFDPLLKEKMQERKAHKDKEALLSALDHQDTPKPPRKM